METSGTDRPLSDTQARIEPARTPVADRQEAAETFRERLRLVIDRSALTLSAFARSIHLDRSTLAQLLTGDHDRLPRAETLRAIATRWKVSADWLLGLTQQEALGADIFSEVMEVTPSEPQPIDTRMYEWMMEAAGYKIRTVPSTFPDPLKTEDTIRFQYLTEPDVSLESAQVRLDYMRRPETEIEVCCAVQSVSALAQGIGAWDGLSRAQRIAQLGYMARLCDELYPSLRLFLYDERQIYSAPFSVFGQKRAAIFLGGLYFSFIAADQVKTLTRRFDTIVRHAAIQPPDVPKLLERWLKEL